MPQLTRLKYLRLYGHLNLDPLQNNPRGAPLPRYFPSSLRVLELRHNVLDQPLYDTNSVHARYLLWALVEQAPELEVLCMDDVLDAWGCRQVGKFLRSTYLDVNIEPGAVEHYVSAVEQLPALKGLSLAGLMMGPDMGGFDTDLAWQLIDRTLEAVPQLEHFTTPRYTGFGWSKETGGVMMRLANARELRSLESLGYPSDSLVEALAGRVVEAAPEPKPNKEKELLLAELDAKAEAPSDDKGEESKDEEEWYRMLEAPWEEVEMEEVIAVEPEAAVEKVERKLEVG